MKFATIKTTPETHYAETQDTEESEASSNPLVLADFANTAASPSLQPVSQEKTIQAYVEELEALENIEIQLPKEQSLETITEEAFYVILRKSIPKGAAIPDKAFRQFFAGLELSTVEVHSSTESGKSAGLQEPAEQSETKIASESQIPIDEWTDDTESAEKPAEPHQKKKQIDQSQNGRTTVSNKKRKKKRKKNRKKRNRK